MSSVGKISLDLNVNNKHFNKQVNGIQKQTTKAFGTMSVAIGNIMSNMVQKAVASVGTFVKDSINKGSELSELQNVVDSVFTTMSDKVENFSKTALEAYGLTEIQSKKMMGTYGAMSKSFGFSEAQAYSMSEALTGLTGDVASFYNLNHDEAYTKLKSVFTGETESLKELGVVMTQTALDEFAMAKGFAKTTKDMSEQEKVALRLAFVQDKLSTAAGDFTKTQDQWANQTRILTGQFDSFKAAIGQGFINVLTPVIRMLNELMAKLVQAANTFKSFTETIMGSKSQGSAGAVMAEVATAAQEAAGATSGIEDAADGAATSAKKAQKALMGFDEINKLTKNEGSGTSSTGFGFGDTSSLISEEASEGTTSKLDEIKNKIEEITKWFGLDEFMKKIQLGFSKIDFSEIKGDAESIFDNLVPIAKSAFDGTGAVIRSQVGYIGSMLGGAISVFGKAFEISMGGFRKFLDNEGSGISSWIEKTSATLGSGFDHLSFSADAIFGSLWSALDINKVAIENAMSDVLSVIANANMTIGTIFADMFAGLSQGISDFFITEKPLIDSFLNGLVETVLSFSTTITNIIGGIFGSLSSWWENDGKRIWGEIVSVFTDLIAWATRIWVEVLKPIIDKLSAELDKLWQDHLQPLWNNILNFVTSVWDFVKALWDTLLKPIVDWIIKNIGPVVKDVAKIVISVLGTVIGYVADVIGGIIRSLTGVLNFITGVFTGDWKKAWGGIKDFFGGIWDIMWGSVKATINLIIDGINLLWVGLYNSLKSVINGVGNIVGKLGEAIGKDWGFSVPNSPPTIPKLAQGGYVRANQPQLAVVGDNRTQGEIISPEGKMLEVTLKALETFFGKLKDSGIVSQSDGGDIIIPIYLDGSLLDEVIVTAQQRRSIRSGGY